MLEKNIHVSRRPSTKPAMNRFDKALITICLMVSMAMISSCSSSTEAPSGPGQNQLDAASQRTKTAPLDDAKHSGEVCRVSELAELWQERGSTEVHDLPVGPSDVINVSVPEIEEIQNQSVRVSARGTINLPLIGTLQVAGLSENEMRDAINQRLLKYMKKPRVELFVQNYRSRSVAIMGAVQKPGYYDMADGTDSVLDMIGLAGGLSPSAAQKIVFSPVRVAQTRAVPAGGDAAQSNFNADGKVPASRVNDASGPGSLSQTFLETSLKTSPLTPAQSGHSIILNLDMAGDEACLGLPARPGDVVVVPVAGQVMVQGWVRNPGAFAVTPGLTILGAVSAAGGAMFSWKAQLLRADTHGGKNITEYSLTKLQSGEETDPSVQSGDVVLVEKSAVGAVPFAAYTLLQRFGTGVAFPIP
jgi:protein involved in polysaccharide export with SLBB domain